LFVCLFVAGRCGQSAAVTAAAAAAARYPRRNRQRAQRDSLQCSCKTKLRADGQAEVHVSSGEESEAVTKEEDGSEDGFVTERNEPVPKWVATGIQTPPWHALWYPWPGHILESPAPRAQFLAGK
jgi:hypothetical protein